MTIKYRIKETYSGAYVVEFKKWWMLSYDPPSRVTKGSIGRGYYCKSRGEAIKFIIWHSEGNYDLVS
jgi:hypothetical protein